MGQHRSHGEPLRKGRISLKLTVRDSHNRNAVEYATLLLKKGKNRQFSGITDEKGSHTFLSIPKGDYELTVTSLGYKSRTIDLHARRDTTLTILLLSNDIAMQDVVVTAYESRGATSASRIDRKAMEHLQPSSFTDLVELLPGNVSKDPSMGSANLIKLREAGGTGPSDYDVTSFGTSFVIDGVPLNNDANMQYISNSWETGRNTTGKGIDMRSISTDDIAKVEIVRGIPSVEYGDLTSGLVNIERKKGGNDLEARFKADMQSQLFYVGKGIELTDKQFTLNTGIDYLDSKIDPRNNRENFKRVTGSIRAEKRWTNDHWRWTFNSNLNYRGTFENDKNDPVGGNRLLRIVEQRPLPRRHPIAQQPQKGIFPIAFLDGIGQRLVGQYPPRKNRRAQQIVGRAHGHATRRTRCRDSAFDLSRIARRERQPVQRIRQSDRHIQLQLPQLVQYHQGRRRLAHE